MERAISADLERVASSFNKGEVDSMVIQLLSNDSSLGDAQIQVSEGQIVGDAIQAAYPDLQMKGVVVSMGGEEIDMELSFSDNGIADGARLEVEASPCPPFTFTRINEEHHRLSPYVDERGEGQLVEKVGRRRRSSTSSWM